MKQNACTLVKPQAENGELGKVNSTATEKVIRKFVQSACGTEVQLPPPPRTPPRLATLPFLQK